MVVSADQSGALGVVSTAQSDVDTDPEDGTDRRLVDRESSERVDAVVIALWSIAAAMTVMLGIFLWHTSPRRRLRLARRRSTEIYEAEGEEPEDGSAEEGLADEGSADEGSAEEASADEGSAEEASAEEGLAERAPAVEGPVEAERAPAVEGSVERAPVEAERTPAEGSAEGELGHDPEYESAKDGSEGSPSLWTLARRTSMRLSRWMGS